MVCFAALKIRDSGGFIETRDAPRDYPFWVSLLPDVDVCPRRLSSVVVPFRRCRHCHGRLSLSCSCVASRIRKAGCCRPSCRPLSRSVVPYLGGCRTLPMAVVLLWAPLPLSFPFRALSRACRSSFRPPFPALSSLWPTLVTILFLVMRLRAGERAKRASHAGTFSLHLLL